MADRLRITELDFDAIKQNLRDFLRQQDEFTDYDFEGSGLSVLLDILAYNTHYNAFYLNMVANESFLDTALLRDSIVSHAKTLGYTPYSKKSATATVNLTVVTDNDTDGVLTLPSGFKFLSNQIDGVSYNFVTTQDYTVSKTGNNFYFDEILIQEGQYVTYRYEFNESGNPKQIFTLPDINIDINTLTVTVSPSSSNTDVAVYTRVDQILDVTGESEVFFVQENQKGFFQIYFGNDVVGKKLPEGAIVTVKYITTNGKEANGADFFIPGASISGYNDFILETVTKAAGGADRESDDRIKYLAPLQYVSQNRIVTRKDYELFVKKSYPNLEAVSVWGGEDEVPPIFGKVFISLKPVDGYYISESEKQRIIDEIINKYNVVTLRAEIRDPEFLYLVVNTKVSYDQSKTTLKENDLKTLVRNSILKYSDTYLNNFSTKLTVSRLDENVFDVDKSITGVETSFKVQKRFTPVFNRLYNYTINFNVPLMPSSQLNKLSSTSFDVLDSNGIRRNVVLEEVFNSYTGIRKINVINSGKNYINPVVKINGDGFGATAKAVVVNGRIQRIDVTNSGTDYTRASLTITDDNGGFGVETEIILDMNVGTLRTVYFNESSEKQVLNSNVGSIDFKNGVIVLNDINILSTSTSDETVRISCATQSGMVETSKNTIITVDRYDNSAINITMHRE